VFAEAHGAVAAVHEALEVQRGRLARRVVQLELARADVPALDRLLRSLAAAELRGIERVLDDELAGHLTAALEGAAVLARAPAAAPLMAVAARFPSVSAGEVEAAVAAFREALLAAVAAAPDGVARLEAGG
jgi:hypothetical protein